MSILKPFALMCAVLLWTGPGTTSPVIAQEKPSAAQPPAPLKPHPDVQALLDKAKALGQAYRRSESLKGYKEALTKARSLQDRAGEALALGNIGNVYSDIGQPQQALEYYQKALPFFRALGSKGGEANTLNGIGLVYSDIGQSQQSLDSYRQALPLFRATENKGGEANVLMNIGVVYDLTGQPQKAMDYYRQSLPLHKAVGNKGGEANALMDIGIVYRKIGEPQQAIAYYRQALPLFRAVGDRRGEAMVFNNMGRVYTGIGQPQKALEYYRQALPLHRAVGDRASEARALGNIGIVYIEIGEPQKAMEYYQQALPLFRAVGNRTGEAITLTSIGSVYVRVQPQKALDYYEQALLLHKAVGNREGEAMVLDDIGLVYYETDQSQKALEYFRQALPLHKAVGDREGEAKVLANLGVVYEKIGQPQKALDYYRQALPLHRAIGDRNGEAITLSNLGVVYGKTGNTLKAMEYYQQALPLSKAVGNKTGEVLILNNIGFVYQNTGQPQKALAHYRQALLLCEKYRENIGSDSEAKQAYLRYALDLYQRTIVLLLAQKQEGEAFAVVQKVKARALLDEIKSSKLDLDKDLTSEEQTQLTTLRTQLAHLNKEQIAEGMRSPDKQTERFKQLALQLTVAQDKLADFRADLYRKRPRLARQQAATTLDLPGMAKLLTPDTALLEYVTLNAERDKKKDDRTLLFVVTLQNGKPGLAVFPITLAGTVLAEKCEDLRAACADKTLRAWEGKAAELFRLLIAPARKRLVGKKRLLICPDGFLWQTPFAALLDSVGKPLWEQYELSFAYSATGAGAAQAAIHDPQRISPTKTLLALANPDFGDEARFAPTKDRPFDLPSRDLMGQRGGLTPLPGTQVEGEALLKTFPDATLLTGKAAQEATVKREATAYRYLHFATHGLFNSGAPLLSSVALAQPEPQSGEDGFLTAREIFDMKLNAELVVLSACNTGRGERRAGEGIVGLTWALFAAGCPNTVVSQWAVDDASTATLMGDFYQGLKRGRGKASALRAAGLKLRRDGVHKHPYYWAAFLLVGYGR